ncbi:MAG: stage II sporulation protein P [Syntrophomonadaceae bacterium]|nr:stage II sporulation protein P [Syntrophomonadaceae bacterium]
MIKKLAALPLLLIFSLGLGSTAAFASHEERPPGQYITLIDENNNIIHRTGMQVYVGDEYIAADNSRYEVVEVIDNTARCIYRGKERMPVVNYDQQQNAWILKTEEIPVIGKNEKPTIAVYHTHSDESYVPSDGKESIPGKGGIYDVGQAFVERLEELGFEVAYSQNNHNPHDINAYSRSRRTAAQLLKKTGPAAIIDVHRDATPPDEYQSEVNGENVTQVKLVVGRQNPNMKTNLEFAKNIKAVMDKKYPGLSNGIFIGKGDYNQDLSPRAILLEVGAHTNSKEEAQKGVAMFAEILPPVLGVSAAGQTAAKPAAAENQNALGTVLIALIVVAAAAGGYYLLNKGKV